MEHEHAHESPHGVASKKSDLSIPLAIVFAGILIGGAILYTDKTNPGSPAQALLLPQQQAGIGAAQVPVTELALRPGDHIRGNPNADVLIIEYSDTECPFCKLFHPTMTQVMDQYEKGGNVAWVYRYFPLDQIHPKSRKEAESLECANELGGNDAFWKYADKIFEVTPANNGLDPTQLPIIASDIGLNVSRFNSCLTSGKYADRVQKDLESGVAIGVRGTPYAMVWNRKTGKQTPIEGALPFSSIKSMIDAALASQAPTTK